MVALRVGIPAVIIAAGVWFVTSSGRVPAQAPPAQLSPAAQDVDKRLRALEEKLDRMLQLLQPQGPKVLLPANIDKTIELISQAAKELKDDYSVKWREYQAFRQKVPALLLRSPATPSNMYAERLNQIEKRRSELQLTLAERRKLFEQIRTVSVEKGKADAHNLVAAAGVKVPNLNAPDAVEAALKVIEAEIQIVTGQIEATEELFNKAEQSMRELQIYEVQDDAYRDSIEISRKLLDAVIIRLRELTLLRDAKQNAGG